MITVKAHTKNNCQMERVYNSQLMTALHDEEGELYVQSPAYLYELMQAEDSRVIAENHLFFRGNRARYGKVFVSL